MAAGKLNTGDEIKVNPEGDKRLSRSRDFPGFELSVFSQRNDWLQRQHKRS